MKFYMTSIVTVFFYRLIHRLGALAYARSPASLLISKLNSDALFTFLQIYSLHNHPLWKLRTHLQADPSHDRVSSCQRIRYFSYNSCVEEYGKRILATRSLRGQLLANLHVLQRSNTEWGEAITVPYGAVIMIEDTHNGKQGHELAQVKRLQFL